MLGRTIASPREIVKVRATIFSMTPGDAIAKQLCLKCGLCCNGVIFRDVELQPADNAARLQSLGLPVRTPRTAAGQEKFPQPCAALDGCRCRIYADRPTYCQQFECALFKAVRAGRVEAPAALRLIRTTRDRAERVLRLLHELGDTDERVSLSVRFRKVAKHFHAGAPTEEAADTFGELTLAVHDLNVLLSEKFYPGGTEH